MNGGDGTEPEATAARAERSGGARAAWLAPTAVTAEERVAEEWAERFEAFLDALGSRFFTRSDLRRQALGYVRELLAGGPEGPGSALPPVLPPGGAAATGPDPSWLRQHLLGRAVWDPDPIRDFTTDYVVDGLADGTGGGVLVLDELSFRRKGTASAGVLHGHAEEFGGVVSRQIGVFAAWSTTAGTAMVDRELYLPPAWDADPERRRRAHVPPHVGPAGKGELAWRVVDRFRARLPEAAARGMWVVADARLTTEPTLARRLEDEGVPRVLAVAPDHPVLPQPGWRRIGRLVAGHARESEWDWLTVGSDAVDTAPWQWWVRRIPTLPRRAGAPPPDPAAPEQARWLVACRRTGDVEARRHFLAHGPADTPLDELASVVATWRHGRNVLTGAVERTGLANYRVRSWHGWYRHVTLAQAAAAFLAVQTGGHPRGTVLSPLPPLLDTGR
ncbi:IS701 family transposase [Streptomyces sp. BI20]|uniref:IS701 family transposase n=1 Tax=Streptomyces sp. BI20 TaxID=3403460 RepID=UPI003C731371